MELTLDLGSTAGSRGFSNPLDFIGKDLKVDLYESTDGVRGALVSTQKVKIIEKSGSVVALVSFANLPTQKRFILTGEIVDGTVVHYTGATAEFGLLSGTVPLTLAVKDYAAADLVFTQFGIFKEDNPTLTQDYLGQISLVDKTVKFLVPGGVTLGIPKIRFISTAAEVKLGATTLVSRDSTLDLATSPNLTLISINGESVTWTVSVVATVTVTFDPAGAVSGTPPPAMVAEVGSLITLPVVPNTLIGPTHTDPNLPVNTALWGWSTTNPPTVLEFNPGESYTVPGADITLYAHWSVIGATGPAGGLVFYDNTTIHTDGWRYLEAGPVDLPNAVFGLVTDGMDATDTLTGPGTGRTNTRKLVFTRQILGDTNTAAQVANNYNLNGFGDWFLPSSQELNEMYTELAMKEKGNFVSDYYWSSADTADDNKATAIHMGTGVSLASWHSDGFRVRPVRAFLDGNPTYEVVYWDNGSDSTTGWVAGVGIPVPVDPKVYRSGDNAQIEVSSLVKSSMALQDWGSLPSGGTVYTPGSTYPIGTTDLDLYGQYPTPPPFLVQSIEFVNGGTNAGSLDIGDSIVITFSESVNPATINSSLTLGGSIPLTVDDLWLSMSSTFALNGTLLGSWNIGTFTKSGTVTSGVGDPSVQTVSLDASGTILTLVLFNASGMTFVNQDAVNYVEFTPSFTISSSTSTPIQIAPVRPPIGVPIF